MAVTPGVIMEDWYATEIADKANWVEVLAIAKELPRQAAEKQKQEAKPNVSSHPRWKRLRPAVTASRLTAWSADVGYAKFGGGNSQSSLAGIAEFGSAYKIPRPAMENASEVAIKWYFEECEKAIKRLR